MSRDRVHARSTRNYNQTIINFYFSFLSSSSSPILDIRYLIRMIYTLNFIIDIYQKLFLLVLVSLMKQKKKKMIAQSRPLNNLYSTICTYNIKIRTTNTGRVYQYSVQGSRSKKLNLFGFSLFMETY